MPNRDLPRRSSQAERESSKRMRTESRADATYRQFLKDLRQRGFASDAAAERAATAVLCALEYRLTGDQTWNLESQLPLKLRRLLASCELDEDLLPRSIHRKEFLELVAHGLGGDRAEAIRATSAVFETLASHVTAGEVLKIIHQLPVDLRELWPDWARSAEEYRDTVRRGMPSGEQQPPGEAAGPVVDDFLQLSPRAQLGLLRALAPWVLARLSPAERAEFLSDLDDDVAEIERTLSSSAPRPFAS